MNQPAVGMPATVDIGGMRIPFIVSRVLTHGVTMRRLWPPETPELARINREVWDHVLSPQEVKEAEQGMVVFAFLHHTDGLYHAFGQPVTFGEARFTSLDTDDEEDGI